MPRYAIGSAPGAAITFALLFSTLAPPRSAGFLALYVLVLTLCGPLYMEHHRVVGSARAVTKASDSTPIVVASALYFPQLWWYSDPADRTRLHYLSDLDYAAHMSDLVPEFSLALEQPYSPIKLDRYRDFLAHHDRFILFCTGDEKGEWVKERLKREGWHLRALDNHLLQVSRLNPEFHLAWSFDSQSLGCVCPVPG